jgi:hypothetical protein
MTPQTPPHSADSPEEKERLLEIILEWKHFWMNQRQNSQADYENYHRRAFGIDANMQHHLATMLLAAQAAEAPGSVDEEAARACAWNIANPPDTSDYHARGWNSAYAGFVAGIAHERAKRKPPEPQQGGQTDQERAKEYALSIEWKGDDYGARKQYYTDAALWGLTEGRRLEREKHGK